MLELVAVEVHDGKGNGKMQSLKSNIWAHMHHKVVGNFGSEADVRSLYFRRFRFNKTPDVGAYSHGQPGK